MSQRSQNMALYIGLLTYTICVFFLSCYLYFQSGAEIMTDVDRALHNNALLVPLVGIFSCWLLFPLFVVPLVYFGTRTMRKELNTLRILNAHLARTNERYKELSYSDALTGLPNRRAFYENGQRAVGHCLRTGRQLHALALDLDNFKNVNDTYGHAVGDAVLADFAQVLRDCLRSGDIVGRCGGEEFGVLLPETGRKDSVDVAERLRTVCAARHFVQADGLPLKVTVSVGVAELKVPEDIHAHTLDDVLNTVLSQADAALYAAKQQGRNKVCVYDEDTLMRPTAQYAAFSI